MAQVPEYIIVADAADAAVAFLAPESDGVSCEVEQELNGACNVIVKLPTTSAKAAELLPERRIVAGGRKFVIMSPASEQRSRDGRKTWIEVTAPSIRSLLAKQYVTVANDYEPDPDWSTVSILASDLGQGGFPAGSAGSALYRLLQGTGWTVGTVDTVGSLIEPHDLETEMLSVLENIQKIQQVWGGYLVWDEVNMTVSLREESAWRPGSGVRVEYAKNLKGITREENADLITRLYPFGQDNLTIASVNGGQLYIDDHHYSPAVYEGIWTNQDIADPAELKTAAQRVLAEISETRATYRIDLADLSVMPEYAHEGFALGDVVRVVDPAIVKRRLVEADITAASGSTPVRDPDCDLNGDGKVDNADRTLFRARATGGGLWIPSSRRVLTLAHMSAAYGSVPGDPNWDADCDLNEDGRITLTDMTLFGQRSTENCLWVASKRGVDLRVIKHRYSVFEPWKCSVEVGKPIATLASMIASSVKAANFVEKALKPNPGAGNLLKGLINTFATTINSANGKLVWSDDALDAVEIDEETGLPTGKRVRISPKGIGISSDGGQTYDVAMTGAGILANRVIVSDLYALATDDGYTQVKGDGLHVFDAAQQERVHVGRWLIEGVEHYGMRVFSNQGTVMMDDQGLLQSWQEAPTMPEVDATHPARMVVYLPPETLTIHRALLRFRREKYRAPATAASSGGGSTSGPSSLTTTNTAPATTSGPSSKTTTDSGGGDVVTSNTTMTPWTLFAINVPDSMSNGGSHNHGGGTGAAGGHNHGLTPGVWVAVSSNGSSVTGFQGYSAAPDHSHSIGSDGSHIHSITADHRHQVSVPSHSHGMDHTHQVPAHSHGMDHTHTVPNHSHGLEFGIYEGPLPTNITVKINGVDRTAA
ncbi:MAG TPA: phage tail spike protein, partial [Symbiobacteriaceae bacterium]|nr:phage tail spike protein [Symbiobacteriaceae bacterium]